MDATVKSHLKKRNPNRIRMSRQDKVFSALNYTLLIILTFIVAYPLYFVLIASISNPRLVASGQVWWFPKDIMWDGYKEVFSYGQLWTGYRNTIFYTVVGTVFNVFLTMLTAYPLSRKNFVGKKFFIFFFMFTMYFAGGLIPSFLVNKALGLYDNWMIMIVAGLISVPNVIICRTFMQNSIPDELYEAAVVDGITHWKNFTRIVLPLSAPVIAVMVLYYGVAHWNDYWTAMVYLSKQETFPLQLVLRGILTLNQVDTGLIQDYEDLIQRQNLVELKKYALIVVSSVPLIVIYPFFQKHFTKGIMVGSLKG